MERYGQGWTSWLMIKADTLSYIPVVRNINTSLLRQQCCLRRNLFDDAGSGLKPSRSSLLHVRNVCCVFKRDITLLLRVAKRIQACHINISQETEAKVRRIVVICNHGAPPKFDIFPPFHKFLAVGLDNHLN